MNNDLISRSELKKAFEDYEAYSDIFPKTVYDIIDNAPTVTNGTYEQGLRVGAYGRLDEIRPQGKWKYKIDVFHSGGFDYCSICNFPTPIYLEKPNFCPNCGADMRGTT